MKSCLGQARQLPGPKHREIVRLGLPHIPQMLVILTAIMVFLITGCTIVEDKKEEEAQKKGKKIEIYFVDEEFNPDKIVNNIWESRLIPSFDEKAVGIDVLLKALAEDSQKACEKYGYSETIEITAYNFMTKGEGKVIAANTESRNRTLDVDVAPFDDRADVRIQIGPVIRGTAIRDALDFISYGDFRNQLEFARLSNAINARVVKTVTNKVDTATVSGKMIKFFGAFTIRDASNPGTITITPVKLDVR